MERPGVGSDSGTGQAFQELCALCLLASLSVPSPHSVSLSLRLYLSLVLGNVNVTLLSKQAK